MHNIHQIDRLSFIDRITEEYNVNLHEIKMQYDKSKKILDDKYNLAIKQINAMYDAYEVTLHQLYSYKTELLNEKLLEFPDFEYSRLNTTLCKIDDIRNTEGEEFSINLNFDIFSVDHSILAYFARKNEDLTRDHRDPILIDPVTLTLKLDKHNSTSEIKVNNIIVCCSKLYYLVIKERDIIILWCNIPYKKYYLPPVEFRKYYKPYVNIIKISTGDLIYNDICYDTKGNIIPPSYSLFMYCNRQIIYYYRNGATFEYVFCSYVIDDSSYGSKVNINPLCIIKFNNNQIINATQFYGDEQGLYICCNGYIYFSGKLDKDIDIYDLDKLTQKFNITKLLDNLVGTFTITSIDYSTCTIYIVARQYVFGKNSNSYTIKLGFSDACNVLIQ